MTARTRARMAPSRHRRAHVGRVASSVTLQLLELLCIGDAVDLVQLPGLGLRGARAACTEVEEPAAVDRRRTCSTG